MNKKVSIINKNKVVLESMSNQSMKELESNIEEIMISYEIIGEGKPIVMIHGLACDMNLMKGCMEPIFEKMEGYKRVYIDLPGMGKSNSTENIASSDKIMEIIVTFIKNIVEEDFLLVGESYGGYITRGILSKMQDRIDGIALICPVIFPENEDRILPEKNVIEKDEIFLEKLYKSNKEDVEGYLEMAVIINERTYERYKNEIYSGIKNANMNFIKKLRNNYSFSFDVDRKIGENYKKPALFIAGKQDHVTGYRQLEKLCNNYTRGTLAVIDGAGHNLQIEKPEIFEIMVKEWLERVKYDK